MSWLFSQALEEAYSAAKSSDGEPSAPSKSTNTPAMHLSHGKTTEPSRLSRFGMTCEPLTDARGEELLMWFLEASRARTSASPEKAAASTGHGLASGAKWRALSVKYDRATSSWRTHRCLFDGDLIESLPTLPKWGLMLFGELSELTTPVLNTAGNGSGYWPTPTVHGNNNAPKAGTKRGTGLATAVKMWPTPTATAYKGWSPNHNRANSDDRLDYTIEREAYRKMYPTVVCQDSRAATVNRGKRKLGEIIHGEEPEKVKLGGRLNPLWVEWLMGWPIGHTGLEPLETARYREWLRWHGEF